MTTSTSSASMDMRSLLTVGTQQVPVRCGDGRTVTGHASGNLAVKLLIRPTSPAGPVPATAVGQVPRKTRGQSEQGSRPLPPAVSSSLLNRPGHAHRQHTELVAIGIGHHHPADLALAHLDSSRPEGDETIDLRSLITVQRWCEVEMQPVPPRLRPQRRTTPRDLRTAARRADRGLLVLVPDQRPAQRLAPEVPDLLRTVARDRSEESAVSKEVVGWFDDAELVALGVGEHDVPLLRALTDVDVPGAKFQRPRHRLLLILKGRARQIEVHLVLSGLLLPGREESNPEPGVIARHERDAVVGVVGRLPAQDAGPEARKTQRVVRIEAERDEASRHPAPHLRFC